MSEPDPMEVFKTWYRTEQTPETTLKKRLSDVRQFREWYDIHGDSESIINARGDEVKRYLNQMNDDGYAETTIEARRYGLTAFFDTLEVSTSLVDENPMEAVNQSYKGESSATPQKKKQLHESDGVAYIEPEEKEALCNNVPAPQVRNELLIRLLWQTGLREHEIRGLELRNVDREKRLIHVRSSKSNDRTLAYHQNLDFLLDQWIDGGYRDRFGSATGSEYLFVSRKLPQMSEGSVNKVVKKAARNAGIQEALDEDAAGNTRWKVTAHTMRHSFAVQCIKNEMDSRFLQELMGHDNIETTEKYLFIRNKEAIESQRRRGAGREGLERE